MVGISLGGSFAIFAVPIFVCMYSLVSDAKLRLKTGEKEKEKSRDARKRTRADSYEREIQEANELRAKLGLAPLEQPTQTLPQ